MFFLYVFPPSAANARRISSNCRKTRHADLDSVQLLRELAKLKGEGVIADAQFEEKQKEVLAHL